VTNLPALSRVKLSLIQRGPGDEELSLLMRLIEPEMTGDWDKDTVLNGRVYAGYPYFQDGLAGVPDDCYDVTEELRVAHHLAALYWEGTRLCLAGYAFIEHVGHRERDHVPGAQGSIRAGRPPPGRFGRPHARP